MPRSKQTNNDLRKRVGERVRGARLARGWSQEKLAESIGVSVESVSRYECGKLALSLEGLERVAAHLGVSTGTLIGEAAMGLSTEENELLEAWRGLGSRGRRAVMEIVRWGREELTRRRSR